MGVGGGAVMTLGPEIFESLKPQFFWGGAGLVGIGLLMFVAAFVVSAVRQKQPMANFRNNSFIRCKNFGGGPGSSLFHSTGDVEGLLFEDNQTDATHLAKIDGNSKNLTFRRNVHKVGPMSSGHAAKALAAEREFTRENFVRLVACIPKATPVLMIFDQTSPGAEALCGQIYRALKDQGYDVKEPINKAGGPAGVTVDARTNPATVWVGP
ncbi:hypothetical protein KOAAANKH_00076 [Brevundimonas sp. NIBR10]|nr:hypothetical protein KOAAANKH_00076 [Brevundimonas sp. NIBR10]